ncbi:MAG: hypothetical protein COV44_01920 [Deltaproteobacteria bacterium CG11_big_fil_rev_8_21_14_0_20_45_16]|nr:MAG: hypothetical protein COV44_01920 [Deltaproteobacteria bacterium CG11_big_fil_rev_8_21_14_0_20_45_16]
MNEKSFVANLGYYEIRKAFLVLASIVMIIIISATSSSFQNILAAQDFLNNLSLLLILTMAISLPFLAGIKDFSLGGWYVLALCIIRLWRQSSWAVEASLSLHILFAICLGISLSIALMLQAWLISKRSKYSVPISLSIGLLVGALAFYKMPGLGPWGDAYACVSWMVAPKYIFLFCVFALIITMVQSVRYFWPELFWIRPVIAVWVASALLIFVVYEYGGLSLGSLLAFFVIMGVYFFLHHSIWGRAIFAMGGNPEAARLCGISLTRLSMVVFVVFGALIALGALFEGRSISNENTYLGLERHLDAFVALMLGGVSYRGGYGSIGSVLTGALFVSSLNLFQTHLAWPVFLLIAIKALGVILAIGFDPAHKEA